MNDISKPPDCVAVENTPWPIKDQDDTHMKINSNGDNNKTTTMTATTPTSINNQRTPATTTTPTLETKQQCTWNHRNKENNTSHTTKTVDEIFKQQSIGCLCIFFIVLLLLLFVIVCC